MRPDEDSKLTTVRELLDIYTFRLQMAEAGVTHPPKMVIDTVRHFVEALRDYDPDDQVLVTIHGDGEGAFSVQGIEIGRIPDTRRTAGS